jgi:dihydroneopterin aldolase
MASDISKNIIFVQDLRIDMHVGIYAHEQGQTQPVIINAEIYLDGETRWTKDDIKETLSYEEIDSRIQKISEKQHFNLLETFLEYIAKDFLSIDKVRGINIAIEKPSIMKNAKSAGVRITRFKK